MKYMEILILSFIYGVIIWIVCGLCGVEVGLAAFAAGSAAWHWLDTCEDNDSVVCGEMLSVRCDR